MSIIILVWAGPMLHQLCSGKHCLVNFTTHLLEFFVCKISLYKVEQLLLLLKIIHYSDFQRLFSYNSKNINSKSFLLYKHWHI